MKLIRILPHLLVLLAVLGAVFSFTTTSVPAPDLPSEAESFASIPVPGVGGSGDGSRAGGRDGEEPGTRIRVRNLRATTGCRKTMSAVDLGLGWLAKGQAADGSWSAGPSARTGPAVTGLVLLSYFGAGETHKRGHHRKVLKNGLRRLKQIQEPGGCYGSPDDSDHAANHAIATLAMCEAYGLTGSPLFKQSAQQALDFILRLRRPGTSVAFWEMLALHAGAKAGLRVPEYAKQDAVDWLDRATEARTGIASCASGGVMPETVPGQTAAAVLCRVFYGEDPKKSELIQAAAKYLVERRPGTAGARGDPGLLYFGTLALFQVGGDAWKKWNHALKKHHIGTQVGTGKHTGTWNPEGRSGDLLGRPGTTALMLMNQQVYYRYDRVFGTRR